MQTLGRYELLRGLARGGMADVFLARRKVGGVEKRMVIKRMRRERARDASHLDLFVREAQLSMGLVQQNIVPVFDFGRIGDDVFIAMEFVEGRDVAACLKQAGSELLPVTVAAYIAHECCVALDYAHHANGSAVVHRDVTPRNILLSWAGEVKLADFGIAAVMGSEERRVLGTPAYMAPEQARGDVIDARADVYALGLVLFEMVTGQRARSNDDVHATLALARQGAVPALPATVPPALAAIVTQATAPIAGDRFASAAAMSEALDRFLVDIRAAQGLPPPRRVLADWMAAHWPHGDDIFDGKSGEAEAHAGAVVTFLDDGVAAVLGTGTMKSMVETRDDVSAIAPEVSRVASNAQRTGEAQGARPTGQARGARARGDDHEALDEAEARGVIERVNAGAVRTPSARMPSVEVRPSLLEFAQPPQGVEAVRAPRNSGTFAAAAPAPALTRQVQFALAGTVLLLLGGLGLRFMLASAPRSQASVSPGSLVGAQLGSAAPAQPASPRRVELAQPGRDATRVDGADPTANVASTSAAPIAPHTPRTAGFDARTAAASADAPAGLDRAPADASSLPSVSRVGTSVAGVDAKNGHMPPTRTPRPAKTATAVVTAAAPAGNRGANEPPALVQLNLGARPWANVTIDDGKTYETPVAVMLAPGPHTLRFFNPNSQEERVHTFVVKPPGPMRFIVDMNAMP